jgi:hypothetical protein
MSKIMYLAERKPGFSDEGFVARWRQHGALAMSLPMWSNSKRYVQASVVRPAPVAEASDAYDCVGVLWMHEDGHLSEPTAQHLQDVQTLAVDELETFAYPIAPVCMAVDETVLKAGDAPFTAYAFFKDAGGARRFAVQAAARDAARRVALNVKSPGIGRNLLLPYEAIVEVSAKDQVALGGVGLGAADLAVVAHDVVLWPRPA